VAGGRLAGGAQRGAAFPGWYSAAVRYRFPGSPFASGLLTQVARLLEDKHWVGANALIYVETGATGGLPPLPDTWQVTKTKQAGAVGIICDEGDSSA